MDYTPLKLLKRSTLLVNQLIQILKTTLEDVIAEVFVMNLAHSDWLGVLSLLYGQHCHKCDCAKAIATLSRMCHITRVKA